MNTTEKSKQNVLKRSMRTIARIDKEIDNLRKASEKVSYESAEYHLITTAICYLSDARGELTLVANLITDKLNEK